MVGEEVPQNRQQGLVRPDHLPDRLDPDRRRMGDAGTVGLVDQPFPRIEVEQGPDGRARGVGEAQAGPFDLVDRQGQTLDPAFAGQIAHIGDGDGVLGRAFLGPGEMHRLGQGGGDLAPAGDQGVVDVVELVLAGEDGLQPVPLDHRGLQQGGGGVAVELEHLRRRDAVIAQVEAAVVQRRRFLVPGLADQGNGEVGDAEAVEQVVVEDVLTGGQAERIQLLGRLFDLTNLAAVEAVAGGLVPVGLVGGGVPDEAQGLDPFAPVRPGRERQPLHQPPEEPRAEAPKPRRSGAV